MHRLPISSLRLGPIANIYPDITGQDWDDLVKSIKKYGVLNPILVRGNEILDGRHRFKAAKLVGCASILCEEYQGTDEELPSIIAALNHDRRHYIDTSGGARLAAKLTNIAPRKRQASIKDQTHDT